jgi:hypothetical protein
MTVAVAEPAPARPEPSPRRVAGLIALAWTPALIVAASLPRFVPVFDRWRWELPPLTAALMPVGRLGVGPIVFAGVVLVAILVGGYASWVRAGLPGRRWVGFALAAAGLLALPVLMAAALGPVFLAPPIGR